MLTNNDCRKAWKDSGFDFRVAWDNLGALKTLIEEEFKIHNKDSRHQMRLSKKVDIENGEHGLGIYLYVNGDYYLRRECISFNRDGFIGFAGWASSCNSKPILNAFARWLIYLETPPQQNTENKS